MYKFVVLLKRRPDLSHEQFVDYYENHHALLAQSVIPGLVRYVRNYVDHDSFAKGRQVDGPVPAPDPYFDVITELWFENEDGFRGFRAAFADAAIAKLIADDEDNLFDSSTKQSFTVDERG